MTQRIHTRHFAGACQATLLAAAALLPLSAFAVTWTGDNGNFTDSTWTPSAPTSTDNVYISNGSTVTISGPGAAANYLYVDGDSTLLQTGGDITAIGRLFVGNTGNNNGSGTYHISGGTLALSDGVRIGAQTNSNSLARGRMIVSDGAAVTSQNSFRLGGSPASDSSSGYGELTIDGTGSALTTWTVNMGSTALQIGEYGVGSQGILNVQGANARFISTGSGAIKLGTTSANTTGIINLSDGGILTATNAEVVLGDQASGKGVINLSNGAVFTAKKFKKGSGTAEVKSDGGILRASAAQADFLENLEINLLAGGLTIDTQGYTVFNANTITNTSTMTGVGGLTKVGSGTLYLRLEQTYTGATKVAEGTLIITQGSIDSTEVEVASGATLELTAVAALLANAVTLKLVDGAELYLNFTGELFVNAISLNGVDVDAGTYSATDGSALASLLSGTGTITVVPEPSTYALLGAAGLVGLVALRRRRK